MLKEIEKQALQEEKKRQDEWNQREARIAQAMSRMGATVIKKQEEQDRMLEEKIRQYEEEKDRRQVMEEEKRKLKQKKMNQEVQETLMR